MVDQTEEAIDVAALGTVSETLLIPLAARAIAPLHFPKLGFSDPAAEAIMARLNADPDRFSGDRQPMLGAVLRNQWFDAKCRAFFDRHPDGLGVSLGAGLNTTFQRIDSAEARFHWVDVDLPEVIAMRSRLIPDSARCRAVAADITDPDWTDRIGWQDAQPAIVMSEGVLMYLEPSQVCQVFQAIADHGERCGAATEFLFDFSSPFMTRNSRRHPSVRKTKAEFRSSLRRPEDIAQFDPGYRIAEVYDLNARCGAVPWLFGLLHKAMTGGRLVYGCVHAEYGGAIARSA